MEYMIQKGMACELNRTVEPKHSALHFGSGSVDVLATPMMISWMEEAAVKAVIEVLPEGVDTVGTMVDVKHLAATPIGMNVRIVAEVTEVSRKIITFSVKAYDEKDKIGEGTHERAVIDVKRFLDKVKNK